MSGILVIVLMVTFLSISASTYISINYKRMEKDPIRTIVKKSRKDLVLKFKHVHVKETSDDSIQGLVQLALKRKKSTLKVENILKVEKDKKSMTRKYIQKEKSIEQDFLKTCPNLSFSKDDEILSSSDNSSGSSVIEPITKNIPTQEPVQFYSPFNSGFLINLDKGSFVDFGSDPSFHDKISPPGFTLHQDRL